MDQERNPHPQILLLFKLGVLSTALLCFRQSGAPLCCRVLGSVVPERNFQMTNRSVLQVAFPRAGDRRLAGWSASEVGPARRRFRVGGSGLWGGTSGRQSGHVGSHFTYSKTEQHLHDPHLIRNPNELR